MALPRWVARVNTRFTNKMVLRKGDSPVITHEGRVSGKTFRTPLDAHQVDNGYIFVLMYGSDSDWVQNILAAGTASLRVGRDEFELVSPRLVTKDVAWQRLPATAKPPPEFLRVTEYLQMDLRG
jgi:deazaflavin-dependent oxidoreductase (nitroreductase family)